ncbi:hypothetical protein E2C01_024408 [Portunus trituberculatus]|uniref:Uncharacterized protein n=1 Tax=Portunus trituberculatus TaxID=210409 RepID=A0A5B7ECR9_PORTR|nr:hypothetical protein [Portunus trituberculatus]
MMGEGVCGQLVGDRMGEKLWPRLRDLHHHTVAQNSSCCRDLKAHEAGFNVKGKAYRGQPAPMYQQASHLVGSGAGAWSHVALHRPENRGAVWLL